MSNAKRVGHRHVLCSGNLGLSVQRRRVVRKLVLSPAAAIAAAGLLTAFAHSARANIPLYTTQEDFAIDPNVDPTDANNDGGYSDYGNGGWTPGGGATLSPSAAFDSDGSTINGIGNLSNPGGTGTAGSLQITKMGSVPYTVIANAPGGGHSQAFMSAIDPGSTAAYTAASSYGAGTETAYSGTLQVTYTVPTYSSLTNIYNAYFQPILVLNDNNPSGGYRTLSASSTVNNGTVDGQATYTAMIPYTIPSGSYSYQSIGFLFNSNYVVTSPFYIDAIQVVTAPATGQSEWITNGNGAYETDSNWSNGEPSAAGSSALFDTDGGTITVSPTVTLSSTVTIDSITFNASSISYTIANGGTGNIKTNSINVLAGSHTINAQLSTGNGAVFNVSSGASLTATNVVDTVGYYHNVNVLGGGSLTVNALNNAALDVNNVTLTTTGTNTGQYVYLENGAVWNIDANSTIQQFYDDATDTLNIASGVTLYTQYHTTQIGGTITGSGSLSLGGGPTGFASGNNAALNGNNSNYSGAITITGGGTLTISKDVSLGNGSATNTLNISNGVLALTGSVIGTHGLIIGSGGGTINNAGYNMQVSSLTGTGALTFSDGGTLTVLPQVVAANSSGGIRALTVGGLNINTGSVSLSTATLQSNRSVLVTSGLSLSGSTSAWTSLLDLGGNDLIVQGGTLATITNQAAEGFTNGSWQGSGGIVSTAAAANTSHLTALGVIQNSANGTTSGTTLHATVDGVASTAADVLVKYTYYGDANLDGKVDGSDYSRIDSGFVSHATGWYNGDFNYDGVINGSDYTLIDNAFNTQGASLASAVANPQAFATAEISGSGASAVPEPTTLGLLVISAAGLLGRRRARRHN